MKYQARRVKEKTTAGRRRSITMVGALLLAISLMAGGTLAWLAVSKGPVTNTFIPAEAQGVIEEDFKTGDSTKSNVYVSVPDNEKSIDVYIRVAVVPTWEDGEGNAVAYPVTEGDLTSWTPANGWFLGKDGYYYYPSIVTPGKATKVLIESVSINTASNGYLAGYQMNLQILAEAIQTTPAAVADAWPKVQINDSGELQPIT